MSYLKRFLAVLIALFIVLSVSAVPAFAAEPITSYGVVKASLLNIRSGASTDSSVVAQASNGEIVGIHWSVPGWSFVTYNGKTGYVSVDYLEVTKNPPASAKQAVVRLSSATLNLRASASTSSAILAQIPNGQVLPVSEVTAGWAKVTYNGTVGYVSNDYLDFSQSSLPDRGTAVSSKGQAVVELAKQHLGKAYVYGASGPGNFDCSGLVYYVYKQMGVTLNRVANDQMKNGTYVSAGELQPGDIVGFSNSSGYVNHVGIYVGNGMMIHSPQTGDVVKYESIVTGNYSRRLVGGRRIF